MSVIVRRQRSCVRQPFALPAKWSGPGLLTVWHERLSAFKRLLVGVFFFPLNSRPNGCQNQQADYDSVALRLHNYHTGAGCRIGGRRRDDRHKGPSAVISPHKTCNVRGLSKALITEKSRIIFEFCLPCKNHQVTAPSVCSGCIYSMITLKCGSFEDLFQLRGKMATLLNF